MELQESEEFKLTPEEEEEFQRELEALGDAEASCSSFSDSEDEALEERVEVMSSGSEDEDDEYSSNLTASLRDLKAMFQKREEKLHDYEDVLCTLSENIRDSTANLPKRPSTNLEGQPLLQKQQELQGSDGGVDKENVILETSTSGKETVEPDVSSVTLSKDILEEAESRNAAARKFKLVEQERERAREKQKVERERRIREEQLRQEEESKLAMQKLEEESRARLAAIEESFKQAEKELQIEVEQQKVEAEEIERQAQVQMDNLLLLKNQEEKRNEERLRRIESNKNERRKIALASLQDKQAARVIQKHYGLFRKRKVAAVKIQNVVRRKIAALEVQKKRRVLAAAIVIQKFSKAYLAKTLLHRSKKAKCIQKYVRRHAAMQKLEKAYRSLVLIQSFFRMSTERTKYSNLKRSAVLIQSHFRMTLARIAYREYVGAAQVIGRAWRKYAFAKNASEELIRKVEDTAEKGSLSDMWHIIEQMRGAGQFSSKLVKTLEEGLATRCKNVVAKVLKVVKQSIKLCKEAKFQSTPLVVANSRVRAEANSLGMQAFLHHVDSFQSTVNVLKDISQRCKSGKRLLQTINRQKKGSVSSPEDFAYRWSLKEISSKEASRSNEYLFWTQAYLMMSLRQETYISQYHPVIEKNNVPALNVSQLPQSNRQVEHTKSNHLTKDMLMLNSPGTDMQGIKDLDLSLEGLTSMKEIRTCKNLRKLCLNSNFISSLDGIQHCSLLEELSMKGNTLTTASELKNLLKVRELHLDGNMIPSIECVSNMKSLKILSADDNKIESFVCGMPDQLELESLSLAGNRIKQLGDIKGIRALQTLDLSRNQIQSLEGIEECTALQNLRISNNYICSMPCITRFNKLRNLTELRLSKNKLTKFPFAYLSLPMLRALYLEENKISEVEPVLGCPLLEKLEMAFNEVTQLKDIASLSPCQRLKFLNLSENPIAEDKDFTSATVKMLPSLTELNNEPVLEDITNSSATQAGTSMLKWNCIQRLKSEFLFNSCGSAPDWRDHMQSFTSNHTLAVRHAPIVASYADIKGNQKGTWIAAINSQWRENTLNACRLAGADCNGNVSKYQHVFVEDKAFYNDYEAKCNEKASLIQKAWKKHIVAKRKYQASSECREKAAASIQRAWRIAQLKQSPESITAKEELRKLKEQKTVRVSQARQKAARQIQAAWRGLKVRLFLRKARANSKYVDEDESDLEDFDDDFLRDFDAEADKFLSTVVISEPKKFSSPRVEQRFPISSGNDWTRHASSVDYVSRSPGVQNLSPARQDPSPSHQRESIPSTSSSPYIEERSPERSVQPSKSSVLVSQESSVLSPSSKLEASESTLSIKEEKKQAKMKQIANEWGFKDDATAAIFMKKRNRMVRHQKNKRKQEKLKDPSVRYQKFKEVTEGREPLNHSPPLHHRNGKALSLARTSLYGPASRGSNRESNSNEGSPSSVTKGKGKARSTRRTGASGLEDNHSISTISMGSDGADPHTVSAIAADYINGRGLGTMINNWSFTTEL